MKWFKILVMTLAALAISCEKNGPDNDDPVSVEDLIPRKDIELTRSQGEFVKSNNGFALDLFKRVAEAEEGKSMLVSPISVTYALGMVDNGAVGDTQKEINEVLGYKGDGIDGLNSFCKTMLEQGAAVDPSTIIDFANMAVINKRFIPLKDSFTKTVQDNFEANVLYKDFEKDDIKSMINKWCEEKTNGMIKDFLSQQVDPLEYAHFLNATYFKGIWSSRFKKEDSRKESFTSADGKKISLNMMHQKANFNYGGIAGLCTAVCLPYGNQAYRMVLLLPYKDKTLDDLKAGLTLDSWNRLGMSVHEVDVKVPSFESEFGTKSLLQTLHEMGIKKAFDSNLADFSNMTATPVFISDILHKAKIKVDEQGAEAAAVTDVIMKYTSVGPIPSEPMTYEFHADRPFLYAITEVSTGVIYFIGQYTGI